MGDRVKMCDKCNRLWGGGTPGIDEIDNLKNCGGHFIDTGIDFHEHLIIENISKDREFFLAMAKLKKDDIIEYNAKMSQFKKQYDEMIAERNKPKCPKCGSENIKSTRSGTLYEVERLLVESKNHGELPKYLCLVVVVLPPKGLQ